MIATGFLLLVLGVVLARVVYDPYSSKLTAGEKLSLAFLAGGSSLITIGVTVALWRYLP